MTLTTFLVDSIVWMSNIIYPIEIKETKYNLIKPPKADAMYLVGRNVPEIMGILNNATSDNDRLLLLKRYWSDTTFYELMRLWTLEQYEDFSHVVFTNHTLPNGLAPQSLSNNLQRLKMLPVSSKVDKKTKDKIISNILNSVNKDEIDFLLALVQNDVESLYPNVTKEFIKTNMNLD